ncbi:MAG: hypothetical protein FWD48_04030 [Oscillospiraceae bacterium]|nr:hypothetical protein [Oscillospiraceae bacterium]
MGNENNALNEFLAEIESGENQNPPTAETTQKAEPSAEVEKPAEAVPQEAIKESAPASTENESPEPKEAIQPTLTGDDSLEAALEKSKKASADRILGNLAEKNPIFKYGSASDPITDKDITFDALRQKYETDFPELEEGQNISWTVVYGKVTENVSKPSKEKVYEVKAKIEASAKFLEALKKAKTDADKSPECIIKPFVRAQKKGDALALPSYKGIYLDYEEALSSGKVISLVPARDGRVYEIRKNRIGVFQSPARVIGELAEIKEQFIMSLPKIPVFLLYQIIEFFRVISKKDKLELLVHLVYDTEKEKYNVLIPKQKVTRMSVDSENEEYPQNIIHVMDIHSHNVMAAKFSSTDDKDEKATRLYGVIGRLDKVMPEIALRASTGGKFIELGADDIFDFEAVYPEEWIDSLNHEMAEAICEADMNTSNNLGGD